MPRPATRVRPGAQVYWPDGTQAGAVLVVEGFRGTGTVGAGGRRCFNAPLDGSSTALPLCFDPQDLTVEPEFVPVWWPNLDW